MFDPESDYTLQRFTIDDPVSLPADAPDGCPHIIDVERAREMTDDYEPEGISAVDTIATLLYKWKPDALKDLLDMSKKGFHWKLYSHHDYEWYVIRRGKNVKVGNKELSARYPDFEIQYKIRDNGAWRITGGRVQDISPHRVLNVWREEDKQECASYDNMFASHLITKEMWKAESAKKLIYNRKVFRDLESKKYKKKTSGAEEKRKKRKIETSEAEKK